MFRILLMVMIAQGCLLAQEKEEVKAQVLLHPAAQKVDAMVAVRKYKDAIALSLKTASEMKIQSSVEGYIYFMLRAAEIETFEVWKGKGFKSVDLYPDYRRPLAYLQALNQQAGKLLHHYPALLANTLFTSAVVYYWLDVPDTSLMLHQEALQLRKKLYGPSSREVADSYLWRAVLYKWGLNRKDLAQADYEASLKLQKGFLPESRYALGSVYFGLANIAMENFRFDEALAFANQYLVLYDDLPYEKAFALQLVANVYWSQDDFDRSLETRMRAIALYETSEFRDDLIVEYSNLANDLLGLERYTEARDVLKKGEGILQSSSARDPYDVSLLFSSLGVLYAAMKDYDSAALYFEQAMNTVILHYGTRSDAIAHIYRMRGEMLKDQNKFREALDDFQKMLIAVIPGFMPEDFIEIPEMQYEHPYFFHIISASFRKADALFDWYRTAGDTALLKYALDNYHHAWRQIIIARTAVGDELSKPFLQSNFSASIENGIACAHTLFLKTGNAFYLERLFDFVESTKYLNVLDARERAERADNSQIPRNLILELKAVRSELSELQRIELNGEQLQLEEDSIVKIHDRILQLIDLRKGLLTRMDDSSLTTAATEIERVSMREIQKQLKSNEQICEFYWGHDTIFTIVIMRDTAFVNTVPRDPRIDSLLSSITDALAGVQSYTPADVQHYSEASSLLFDVLFAPVALRKNLIIIPDGPLSAIPVEALVINHNTAAGSYRDLQYALHQFDISYAYSARVRFYTVPAGRAGIQKVLAFSYGRSNSGAVESQGVFAGLAGSAKEIEVLSDLFGNVSRFTGEKALKTTFMRQAGQHDLIHLAVHGVGDRNSADHSRLVFVADSINTADLYAYEIYNLDLHARLAVLSACETGSGKHQAGEGIFSIGRAFTYAGCPSVVMSLWRAHDLHTASIITNFYRDIREGHSIAASLADSKRKFLNDADEFSSHPSNWAAFILNGQDQSFEPDRTALVWWVGVMFAIIILVLLGKKVRSPVDN